MLYIVTTVWQRSWVGGLCTYKEEKGPAAFANHQVMENSYWSNGFFHPHTR